MSETKSGVKSIKITGSIAAIMALSSNIYFMIGEVIDNALGSLGKNIKKGEKIDNQIEIFFEEINNNELNLTITDDCGGFEPTEKNIEKVMRYGNAGEYKEPFFHVYGHGLKDAAIWSGKEFELKTVYEGKQGAKLKASWDEEARDDGQKYEYDLNNKIEIFWKARPGENKIERGTQVFFGNLYQVSSKYDRPNLKKIFGYLGWRYSKYISAGLKIHLYFQSSTMKNINSILGAPNDEVFLLEDRSPKYESFEKIFNSYKSKIKNANWEQFSEEVKKKAQEKKLKPEILEMINKKLLTRKPLIFSGTFTYRDEDKENSIINFPYKIGILELKTYKNAYNYKDALGLSVYQAQRAIEHGPNLSDSMISPINTRLFKTQVSGRTSIAQRWIGEIDVDEFVKNNINNINVMSKNKETFWIDKDIMEKFLMYINQNYEVKYNDFLVFIKELQESIDDKKNSRKKPSNQGNSRPTIPTHVHDNSEIGFDNETKVDHNLTSQNSRKIQKIFEGIESGGLKIEFRPVDMEASSIGNFLMKDDKKTVVLEVNKVYFEKYGLGRHNDIDSFIIELLFNKANEDGIENEEIKNKIVNVLRWIENG